MHKAAQQANWCLLHLANNPTVAVSTAFELTINGLDDLAKTAPNSDNKCTTLG